MASPNIYWEVIRSAYEWCKKYNKFEGYDPYDFGLSKLSSFLVNLPKGTMLNTIFTQLLRYSPVNLRPVFGINKHLNLNALVQIGRTILNMVKGPKFFLGDRRTLDYLLTKIYDSKLVIHNTYAWSRIDYDFFSDSGVQKRNNPIVFLTSIVGELYLDAYEKLKFSKYLKISKKVADYILLFAEGCENRDCLYYAAGLKNKIFNANAVASAFLARIYFHTKYEKYLEFSTQLMRWVINNQNRDGSWYYGFSQSGEILPLIDFHQGYIIDSIIKYLVYTDSNDKEFEYALKKGILFYKQTLFDNCGRSFYRWPKWRYPVDIHNQAQGIITFSLYGEYKKDEKYVFFAKKIADWTLKYMWDSQKKIFYYQYTPLFKNKIPYIRWGQSWMMYALSVLINSIYEGVIS